VRLCSDFARESEIRLDPELLRNSTDFAVFEKIPIFTLFEGEYYTSGIDNNPNQLTLFDL